MRKQRPSICVFCGESFLSTSKIPMFCSIKCRNTYISRHKPRKKGIACPGCGKVRYFHGAAVNPYCTKCQPIREIYGKFTIWTQEEIDFLIKNFPHMGADEISKYISKTRGQIQSKANTIGLIIDDETRRRLVYDVTSQWMRTNNPSKRPGATEYLRENTKRRLQEHPEHLEALMEGHRKIQKDRPTKLEIKLFSILDSFGIVYESHYLIKPKFVVDAKIDNLIIQADGDWWHGHSRFEPLKERQIKQRKRDVAQDAYLSTCGYTVVRIWESEMTEAIVRNVLVQYGLIVT